MAATVTRRDYERAESFLPWNAEKLVYNTELKANWIEKTSRFWYVRKGPEGKTFMVVHPGAEPLRREPAFDHARLAAALSVASGTRYVADALPFDRLDSLDDGHVVFTVGDTRWRCSLDSYECECDGDAVAVHESISPDGKWVAFVKDGNVYVRSREDGAVTALTSDGTPDYGYGTSPHRKREVTDRLVGIEPPPMVLWSPDSKHILTHRLDLRNVEKMHLVQSIPEGGGARPVLHSYPCALVGDEHVPHVELVIIDVPGATVRFMEHDPLMALTHSPLEAFARRVWWDEHFTKLYFVREERGFRAIELCEIDIETGKSRTIVREESDTFLQIGPDRADGPIETVAIAGSRGEALWWSERDGWGHLYLYDLDGTLKNQITRGEWVVHKVHHVDEEAGVVYFTAGGREPGREPYYGHLYRADLTGDRIELLTPEDAHHEIQFAPDGSGFVDKMSKVNEAPRIVWRSVGAGTGSRDGVKNAGGGAVDGAENGVVGTSGSIESATVELERADVSRLLETGWKWPEPFAVKASDGVTDLHGVMFFPPDFDEGRQYPVLDNIYPGPQSVRTPKAFTLDAAQALTALGFIVLTVDGPGTSFRSKAFHNAADGRGFAEAGSLGEHVHAIKQLGARRPYMDLDRVGIFGHSAGGFASAKAMFKFPDFFKVAVSSAGNHDQRGYRAGWAERYIGMPDGDDRYDLQANARLAHNLKGKLFLSYGEMDDNVHPAMTIQLVDALIKANKDFDLLVLPNQNHGYNRLDAKGPDGSKDMHGDPYFIRRLWDYFIEHLLGAEPVRDYALRIPE